MGQVSPKEDFDERLNPSAWDREVQMSPLNLNKIIFVTPENVDNHLLFERSSRDDPAFKKMVSLCRDSTYTEFFWFPNRGTEEGYWENCWTDDGLEEDAVDINESVADEYQVVMTWQLDSKSFLPPTGCVDLPL